MQNDKNRMQKQLQTKKVLGEFSQVMHSLENKNKRQFFKAVKLWDAFSDGLVNDRIRKNMDEIVYLGVFAEDALLQVITIAHEYQTRKDIAAGKVDAKLLGKRIQGNDMQGAIVSKLIEKAVSLGANTNNFHMAHPYCVTSDMSKASSAIEFAIRKNNFWLVKLLVEPKKSIDHIHVIKPLLHLAFSEYEPIDNAWEQNFLEKHSEKNKIREAYTKINRRFIQNYIIDKIKEANVLNEKLQNVLHVIACQGESVDIPTMKNFIQKGLLMNQRDALGETPIHIMARSGDIRNVETLKFFNPDWNVRNYAGKTPLHVAAMAGNAEMFAKLRSFGADASIMDFQEKTPFDYLKRVLKEREILTAQQELQPCDSKQHEKYGVANNDQLNAYHVKNSMDHTCVNHHESRLSCWQTHGKNQKSFSSTSLNNIH